MSKPIKALQENASEFFDQFFRKYKSQMKCANGCAKCCHVDLSIFTSEATQILEWFLNLEGERKEKILNNTTSEDRCIFLDSNNSCTVYEVRPVICRTQGALLLFRDETHSQAYIDICPLNFEKEELPPAREALDLDRLNLLLATCQQNSKVSSKLKALSDGDRIRLRELFEILKNC